MKVPSDGFYKEELLSGIFLPCLCFQKFRNLNRVITEYSESYSCNKLQWKLSVVCTQNHTDFDGKAREENKEGKHDLNIRETSLFKQTSRE